MADTNRIDINLDVDEIREEDMSHVWGVLSRVAEGLALDGHEVALRLYRWSEDGGPEELVCDTPGRGEGSDLP